MAENPCGTGSEIVYLILSYLAYIESDHFGSPSHCVAR